ncbi:acyl-CoA dehydrogenase [Halomicronema hongdechloris C2206]|uniref:Acyl-coenzyme A dehydrogenase n=1 Tax=Halomicronema hongdechloris C2206 TaxID=1641165 RepID=A0A1Z3HJL1_9CYAN|nr:acyl-CoA dehydrogenase [Halomicronema hongdechloris]ASC70491.1 acyl-CoA dehydrogenase [Halomicronema hongdechloris C2206]
MVLLIGLSLLLALVLVFTVPFLRRPLISRWIMRGIRAMKLLPRISDTERAAIEAGNVWIEGEFFTGQPNFGRMLQEPYPELPPAVQAFLQGPVEQVCELASDWQIYQGKDLPPQVWQYLKQEKFFGLMIPEEFGGLGFSNLAYSAVMVKLASRSFSYVATVGVANSLGPAKLLLRYGTPEQKARYLPRLAIGEEIPCFALTEPMAGSDAANLSSRRRSIPSRRRSALPAAELAEALYHPGCEFATLLGLAFRLYDPENLLGKGTEWGITCALVPTHLPGVHLDRRHDPMGVPFFNSPTEGHDVILPVDQIIGGVAQAGQGWKMLMQTLAAGRGISFPATCSGVAQLVSRVTSAHAVVRQQFGLSIGRFEGIEAPLARIAGLTYIIDATRHYTCGAVDKGEQPAVVSAIAKYTTTELARQIINDGMDIMGGSGICRGPHNLLAHIYTATPISITVEGANILTRTLMIFGQGAIRCHPYLYGEIQALEAGDLVNFDRLLWRHLGTFLMNGLRSLGLSLTQGQLVSPPVPGPTARYYRKLTWAAALFAWLTDIALLGYGGRLKRQENLTGRFADVLSWLYLATATLRRYHAEGQRSEALPLVEWSLQHSLAQIQQACQGVLSNLEVPIVGSLLRWTLLPWLRLNPIGTPPADELGSNVAQALQRPGTLRQHLTAGIYVPSDPEQALGRLDHTLAQVHQAEAILRKVKGAIAVGQLPAGKPLQRLDTAHAQHLITTAEYALVKEAAALRLAAIQVDAFTLEEYEAIGIPAKQGKADSTLLTTFANTSNCNGNELAPVTR